jgi:hypothetical protein
MFALMNTNQQQRGREKKKLPASHKIFEAKGKHGNLIKSFWVISFLISNENTSGRARPESHLKNLHAAPNGGSKPHAGLPFNYI